MSDDDDRLLAIEQRASAAIPGPWGWFGNTATHQIYLGTRHSGRIILLTPNEVKEEYVWNHDTEESMTLEEARKAVLQLCGAHDENYTEFGGLSCRCEDVRLFLQGELEIEEGARHMMDRDDRHWSLSRNLRTHTELRFQGRRQDGSPDILLHSYSDGDIARYEVLNGRTLAEHLAAGGKRSDLYREDIVGLASPEAEFIAHARDDVAFLLQHIDKLEEQLADCAT